ncbi:MAG: substrate-binding domain-containing protein [Piscinibacter sp.]|uniref:substrate-binding domain-containing protein n=1 Tax=Piscinibacter defluvii TaxID=1796922 RepID=UPI000FDD490A|nr:substrate-binding domain-containing protein [Piscinibacter sp.]
MERCVASARGRAIRLALCALASCLLLPDPAAADPVEAARQAVDSASGRVPAWTGPTSGPAAAPGKTVVVLAEDLRNGGVLGVAQGIREAARAIGWKVRVVDAGGTAAGRRRAVSDALAARPDGLVICGSDAHELEPVLRAAGPRLPPVVGWHAGPHPGPIAGTSVAMNVSTDPIAVARTTALAAVAQSGGRAGVVVFNDSRFAIATAKAQAMADVIRQCGGCTLLELRDVAISDAAARMPAVTRELLAAHGPRWTHALAINDIYFDYAVPVLIEAALPNGAISLLSAGDGSASAFMRIRAGTYQTGTVAEPLNMQGWQVIDELNRLFAGQPVSGFVAPVRLVSGQNVASDGGSRFVYDPENGYRDVYLRIWKKR